jgi:hypothetical protein
MMCGCVKQYHVIVGAPAAGRPEILLPFSCYCSATALLLPVLLPVALPLLC